MAIALGAPLRAYEVAARDYLHTLPSSHPPQQNQFLLPMAIALGAPISAYEVVVKNLIPATLGNWVGGAICVATVRRQRALGVRLSAADAGLPVCSCKLYVTAQAWGINGQPAAAHWRS